MSATLLRKVASVVGLLVVLGLSAPVIAVPISAGWPPPGEASFFSSGSLISSPGSDRNYEGFNSSAWDALYFNLTSASLTAAASSTVTLDTSLSSPSIAGNTLTWSLGNWTIGALFFPKSIPVYLATSFFDASNHPISTFVAGSAGMPTWVLKITPTDLVSWGGGFHVNQLFVDGANVPIGTIFNSLNTLGGTLAQTNGAFWYDPPTPQVPEPATLALLCIALVGLSVARRLRE